LLEGFSEEALGGLRAFMVRAPAEVPGASVYRVVFGGGGAPYRTAVDRASPTRRPFQRYLRRKNEDLVLMPGCRLHFVPGRPEALLEIRARVSRVDGFVLTSLLELALTHALAMGGYVVSHAAAFELDGVAVLAVGPTRAGKSTLCASVLAAGGAVVSDDSVILGLDRAGAPVVGALRRNFWLRDGSVDLLPGELRPVLRESDSFGEKRWGLDREASPRCFRPAAGPHAIVLLRRDRRLRDFRFRKLSAADGLVGLILATSSLYLSSRYPIEQERCMPTLTRLVEGVPCFEVRMGRALVEDPVETVLRLVEGVCR